MKADQLVTHRYFTYLSITVLLIFVALFLSLASFLMASQGELNYSLSVTESILFEIICISPWIICIPGIVWLARRYNFERPNLWKSFAVHLLAALVLFSFHSLVQSSSVFLFFHESFSWSYIRLDFIGFADMRILLYAGLLLGVYTIDFYRKSRESNLREPRIRAELNKYNFQKILNHLQPDFLIKSISTIKSDIEVDPKKAEKHLNELASLLRLMLKNLKKEEVMFSEDMDFLNLYLDLTEQRLNITIERVNNIDPRCYGASIPNFLFIMPFIEELLQKEYCNPTKIKRFTNEGWIENGILYLDGIIEEVDLTSEELGQINRKVNMGEVQKRLHNKYGDDFQLRTFQKDKKIHILLSLPFKKSEEDLPSPYEEIYGGGP